MRSLGVGLGAAFPGHVQGQGRGHEAVQVAVQALVADGRYADVSALASTLETMLEDTGFVLPSWDRKLVAAALAAAEAQHPRGADAPMDPERALEVAWRALAGTPGGNVP